MKIIVRALTGASYALAISTAAVLLMAVAVPWLSYIHAASSSDIESASVEQTSREGAVTVKIVPRSLAPDAQSWDFEITLDTHAEPLTQDLVSAAALIDATGSVHAPIGWEGDPPGAHHRQGLLRFQPLAGSPAVVELHMRGIGGVPDRVFRWKLQ